MRIALISFSDSGKKIGDRLVKYRNGSNMYKTYTVHHYENSKIMGGVKEHIGRIFNEYNGIIFISAMGIAVRMIAPYVQDKRIDPAVVVIDDLGRFSISLLSGHIGGANELARWAASILGSVYVITTASDGRGIEAIDNFAKKNDYIIEDMASVKNIMIMMINDEKIGYYSEDNKTIDYKNLVLLKDLKNTKNVSGIIAVTSTKIPETDLPYTVLRPKNINIGIGCKKNTEAEIIIEFIKEELKKNNLSEKSIKALGTIDIKRDEKGIKQAADFFQCPLKTFNVEQIRKVEHKFNKSNFVKETVGVYSVAEPCAYLLGGNNQVFRKKKDGVTLSISVEVNHG